MGSSGSLWPNILLLIVLTFINAIFSASELAFVSINHAKITQLADEGDKRAKRVLMLLEQPDRFLATIQVIITLAGFLSSAAAATSFVDIIHQYLPKFAGSQTIATVIVTILLSYFSLVFGELFPKQIALQMPERLAMTTSGLVATSQLLFSPFIYLLSGSVNILKKITPIEFTQSGQKFTREEMNTILHESRKEGSIDLEEFTMLRGVLSLDELIAREIMVPRIDTIMVDIEDDYRDILNTLLTSPYSRIPVYQGDKDNVIGIIHIRQLLIQAHEYGFDDIDIIDLATEPLFVPSTIYIDDLLIEFRRAQQHMAILKDEYGGVEGIATLEDVIEEIVGEIEDESDLYPSDEIIKMDDYHYVVNGMLTVDKFNDYFHVHLESEEVDTIAGLMIYHIGFVPEDDDEINIRVDDYVLKATHIEKGRIRELQVIVDPDNLIETEYNFIPEEEQLSTEELSDT